MRADIHPAADCRSDDVGEGATIGPFAIVHAGARIGANCHLAEHVIIDDGVVLDDEVVIRAGAHLCAGTKIGRSVGIGPGAVLATESLSDPEGERVIGVEVGPGAALGANCTVLPGVRIGRGARVGAGSVVTHDVPPNAVAVGNPARISGYTERVGGSASPDQPERVPTLGARGAGGAYLYSITMATDLRGSLVAADFADDLPFAPERAFVIFDVPGKHVRGAHAHKVCEQSMVCLRGAITCLIDDGSSRQEFRLDRPDVALYMPAGTWGSQYNYTEDAMLLVFASLAYDPEDYIRDYDEFLHWVSVRP